jgi:tetratricopeptide (TPR) repeat protein
MRDHLLRVLGETGWNISRSAAVLGISRNTLRSRIERLGLHRSGERPALAPAVPVEPAPAPPLPDLRPVASTIPAPGPAVVRWERRRVTLLRAEIYPPPDAEGPAEASRALETIMEKVRSFGGWTQDLAVTWIGAAFGVAAVEDGPRRAVHAAMAIQKAAERGRRGDGEPFAVRFGVHVAEFLVGQTGIGLELDADAKQREGATLASLIETAAADTIVATSAAAPFLERHFDLTPIAGATAGYRLVGRERPSFTLGRRPAHFVGRQQELTLIRSRLDSARAGRGQIVGIVGEAGIGKSRLLYELRQTLRGGRVTYLEGRCFSYGTSIPYLPVLEIVRQACRVSDSDTPEAVHRKLAAAVAALGLAPEDTVPYLLNFLGIKEPGTADRRSGLSPDALRKRTIDVLRQMAARASARQPLVLAVEDFHWIDNASASLTALVESLMALPILVILTYRPGVRSSWLDRPHVTQLALQPLSPEESLNVVTAVLPPHLTAAPVARAIVAAAEGNPFFLEELARSIRDRGQTALTDVVVPETVEEVLRARIDHLPDRERSLLQAAAVIGKHVPPDLLRAVADLPEEPFEEALARLQAAEFLYETEAGDEAKYSFKHQLTQEVAYRSLLPDRRRALHARIVDHVERHSAAHLLDQSATLAQHTVGAERWEKAATYLREAGARALARSANREAAARFEEALGVLPHLPEDRRREELAIDLRFDLRNALTPLAEMEATIQALREAEALAQRLGDRHRLGRALSFATNCLYLMGNARSAIEAGTQARSLAEDLDDLPLQVATDMYVGRAYHALGDYRRAIQTLERPVGALVGDRVRDHLGLPVLPAVFSRALLATSLAEVGDFRAGARLTAEARSLAEAARHADTTVWACWSSGYLLLLQGDSERAGEVLEQALAVCRANDLPTYAPRMSSDLGLSYALRGRVKDGIEMIERAVEEATARKQVALLPALTLGLGHAYLLGGRAQEARDIGSRSLIHAREHGERGHEAYALRMLADGVALAERDAPAPADEYYRAALALATDLGMRPLTAWCQLGLGQLLARVGQRAEARAIVTTAAALFREMEMGAGFAQAEGALYRLA